jgi:hypothetical protein
MGWPAKGRADFLSLGANNVECSLCGRKRKDYMLEKNWQGFYRCPEHNEPRQPQDFVRNVKDIITPPISFYHSIDTYVGPYCGIDDRSAFTDLAVADCSIADNNFVLPTVALGT